MDPFTIAIIGSTALNMYGNYKANMDEAAAEKENEIWMREQAEWIKKSTKRELDIYKADSADTMAAMVNSFASAGQQMSGTAMAFRQQEEMRRNNELDAIGAQGAMNLREAYLKVGASEKKQSSLTSGFNNFSQAASIGLSGSVSARNTYISEKQYKKSKG